MSGPVIYKRPPNSCILHKNLSLNSKMSPTSLLVLLLGLVILTTSSLADYPKRSPLQKPPPPVEKPPNQHQPPPNPPKGEEPLPGPKPPKGEKPPPEHKPSNKTRKLLQEEKPLPDSEHKPPSQSGKPPKEEKPLSEHKRPSPFGKPPPRCWGPSPCGFVCHKGKGLPFCRFFFILVPDFQPCFELKIWQLLRNTCSFLLIFPSSNAYK